MTRKQEINSRIALPYLVRLLIFWLFSFIVLKLLFLFFYTSTVTSGGWVQALKSIYYGFPLDLATTAYLIFPAFVLWSIHQFKPRRIFSKINIVYHAVIIFIIVLLAVSNIKMYHEWGALVNVGVFDYLLNPKEVMSFISTSQLLLLSALLIIITGIMFWLWKKFVVGFSKPLQTHFSKSIYIVLSLVLLPVMARGGLQLAPINESSAYYSDIPFFNHVAINQFWYFIHSYLDRHTDENEYVYMDQKVAESRNQYLFSKGNKPSDSILTTTRPNIVIIILESWTADIIRALGGELNVTPQFDTLVQQGLLFTDIYSAGARTEHGLVSVLSGFPPLPQISIITIPSKAEKLYSINQVLDTAGYASSFFYGGEIGFANMKSYLVSSHFKHIVDKSGFNKEQWNSKWGAHDQFVLERQLNDLNEMKQPFLSVLLTLSTHEPFEVPMNTPFDSVPYEAGKFRKAAYYTDHSLGEYFSAAKKEPWYANTLFILVADHGHKLPWYRNWNSAGSKHIPLLFYGDILKEKYRGTTIDLVGNQNDLAATLLNQLGISHDAFPRSKDLLNPGSKPFAYYTNNNVYGWITPGQVLQYTYATKKMKVAGKEINNPALTDSLFLDSKAYLQTHYQDFLDF